IRSLASVLLPLSVHDALPISSLVFGGLFVFLRDALKPALIAAPLVFLFFLFGDPADWVSKTFALGPARSGFAIFLVAVAILSVRSEEHTSELQSRENLVCRLL